jgi:SAM-dependent methyltransferase
MESIGEMLFNLQERIDASTPEFLKRQHLLRYLFAANLEQIKGLVGDLPCGTGAGSAILAQGGGHILSIDRSIDAIAYAKQRCELDSIDYVVGDLTDPPLHQNIFDLIVCFEFIEHIHENVAAIFMKRCTTLLKSDGLMLISTPVKIVKDFSRINPYHVNEMSAIDLERFVNKQGFKIMHRYGQAPLGRITYPILRILLSNGLLSSKSDPSGKNKTVGFNKLLIVGRLLVHNIEASEWNCKLVLCPNSRYLSLFSNQVLVLKKIS